MATSVVHAPSELVLAAAPGGRDGALDINQNVRVFVGKATARSTLTLPIAQTRYGWVQVIEGDGVIEGTPFGAGDGVAISAINDPNLEVKASIHFLLFDLA